MATVNKVENNKVGTTSPYLYSRIRSIIETTYYRNNVVRVTSLAHAYNLAKESSGTIVSDLPIYRATDLHLPNDAKVLIFNDGHITGRQAKARRLVNTNNKHKFASTLQDAVFASRKKTMYHAVAYIGLDKDFMVKAHLIVPEGYENTLYSWMLNFQHKTAKHEGLYQESNSFEEGDILLYSDPDYYVDDFPTGLSLFDHKHNVGALLGLKYFGEHKKASLTMAWSIASRQGFTACHGGMKRFNLDNDKTYIAGVFGLSGSGKSTITHSRHNDKYDITVLHDDAFIISDNDGSSISLEPSYFDKVQDYPTNCFDNKYLLTMQNVAVTKNIHDQLVPVTEDIRNGNGRALKSKFWTMHRDYKFNNKVDAIFWLMKDNTLPPILKINSSTLGSALGATLATKRSSAEHGAISSQLVIEPYANPFRLYPLRNDYNKFKDLFENNNIDCYVLNTGYFLKNKITKEVTLSLIEGLVEEELIFEPLANIKHITYSKVEGYIPDFTDEKYREKFIRRLESRVTYIDGLFNQNILPDEAKESIQDVINSIQKLK